MGITITPQETDIPMPVYAPIIEAKALWADDWQMIVDAQGISMSVATASHDIGEFTFRTRYGYVKNPLDTTFATVERVDYMGWWVRVSLIDQNGANVQWVGRVSGEARDPHVRTDLLSGSQTWTAYEVTNELRKVAICESYYVNKSTDTTAFKVGSLSSINKQTELGRLAEAGAVTGNRSTQKIDGVYVFGGKSNWTWRQAVEYFVKKFAPTGTGQPTWAITGQLDPLDDIEQVVNLGASATLYEILKKFIRPDYGLDWRVVSTDTGFAIEVLSLSTTDQTYEGVTLPANPYLTVMNIDDAIDIAAVRIVRTRDHQYSKIRVLGKRIVSVFSLYGDLVADHLFDEDASLFTRWSSTAATQYLAGTGTPTDTAAKHDAARMVDQYREVFQSFGAAWPEDWTYLNNRILPGQDDWPIGSRNGQNRDRNTLSWTPLQINHDYSTEVPTYSGIGSDEFMPPAVWIKDTDTSRFVLADEAGVSVSVKDYDWGVQLQASPNHLLALNHWTGAAKTGTDPKYDYDWMAITIAMETDQRLCVAAEVGSGDGSVLDLVVDDAEGWWMSDRTCWGVDSDGALKYVNNGRFIRDDRPLLSLRLAGAVARYMSERARGDIAIRGLVPWAGVLGNVLTCIQQTGDTHPITAVVTSIQWTFQGQPVTTIKTGFAQ